MRMLKFLHLLVYGILLFMVFKLSFGLLYQVALYMSGDDMLTSVPRSFKKLVAAGYAQLWALKYAAGFLVLILGAAIWANRK